MPDLPKLEFSPSKKKLFSQAWIRLAGGLIGGVVLGLIALQIWMSQTDTSKTGSLDNEKTGSNVLEYEQSEVGHSGGVANDVPKSQVIAETMPPPVVEESARPTGPPMLNGTAAQSISVEEAMKMRQHAIAEGNLDDALTWVEKLSELTKTDSVEAKATFLAEIISDSSSSISKEKTVETFIELLDGALAAKNNAVVKKNGDIVLLASRKAGRRDLERRATLLILGVE